MLRYAPKTPYPKSRLLKGIPITKAIMNITVMNRGMYFSAFFEPTSPCMIAAIAPLDGNQLPAKRVIDQTIIKGITGNPYVTRSGYSIGGSKPRMSGIGRQAVSTKVIIITKIVNKVALPTSSIGATL